METTIHSLNDDILVQIFSYVDTDHLILSVYEVCDHWKHVIAYDSRIWKNRWLIYDVSCSVNDFHKILNRSPLLKCLKLVLFKHSESLDSDELVTNLLSKVPYISKLEINFAVSTNILTFLNPKLLHLHATNICRQDYNSLKLFSDIETLKLGNSYDFCGRHLCLIADHCKKIKNLHIGECRYLLSRDIIYFLKKCKTQIERLEINGYGLPDQVFNLLVDCIKLQELKVHDSRLMSYSTLTCLVHLTQLKILHLSRLKHRYDVPDSIVNGRYIRLDTD